MTGIVIVNYRSDSLTTRFVKEELSKIVSPHRIIIVDVGGTFDKEVPGAEVIKEENIGFAHACNAGAKRLKGEVSNILFTNNDVRLTSPDVIEVLEETLRRHPEAGAVGPEILGPDGHRQGPSQYMGMWKRYVWMYLSTPFISAGRKRELFHIYEGDGAKEGPWNVISAAFILVDAESFFKAGMFDENTFLYAEENILSERMGKIGKCFVFNPAVSVFHEKGVSISSSYDKRRSSLLQWESMRYYYRHYRSYSLVSCSLVDIIFRLILLVK